MKVTLNRPKKSYGNDDLHKDFFDRSQRSMGLFTHKRFDGFLWSRVVFRKQKNSGIHMLYSIHDLSGSHTMGGFIGLQN